MFELEDEFEALINQFFRSRFSAVAQRGDVWHPPTDIYETHTGTVVRIELAGVNPKDIQILIEGRRLIVQGIRIDRTDKEKTSYHQMEITYGPFRSIFILPFMVKAKEVKSAYKDGFLEIKLPHSSNVIEEIVVVNVE